MIYNGCLLWFYGLRNYSEIIQGGYVFQDFSYVKLNESHSGNMGKLSGDIIKENFNESSGISRVINLVTNSTESKVDRIIHFSDTETTDIATKKVF